MPVNFDGERPLNLDIVWKTVQEVLGPELIVLLENVTLFPSILTCPRRWDHDLREHQSVDLEFTN